VGKKEKEECEETRKLGKQTHIKKRRRAGIVPSGEGGQAWPVPVENRIERRDRQKKRNEPERAGGSKWRSQLRGPPVFFCTKSPPKKQPALVKAGNGERAVKKAGSQEKHGAIRKKRPAVSDKMVK